MRDDTAAAARDTALDMRILSREPAGRGTVVHHGSAALAHDPGCWTLSLPFQEVFHPIAERLLEHCDGVLRIGGPSQGADLMIATAERLGRAVYRRLQDIPGCTAAGAGGAASLTW
jgi:hypothetical protein